MTGADMPVLIPRDALEIGLVLILSLFVGLEREEVKQHETAYAFGGVRTLPLIGLVSYVLALISGPGLLPWVVGLALVGGFMLLSYQHKLAGTAPSGLTAELSALATYAIGGLVLHEQYWIATTLAVVSVLLLELKRGLEGLTRYIASSEILTAAKFLVLAAVVLPILPNQGFTTFGLNPFKIWLVVVAVSGVSFASYVLQRVLKGRASLLLSAVLGGAYSSTVTTVVLARQSRGCTFPGQFAGSILTASAMMYARLVLLIAMFNTQLAVLLAPAFGVLAVLGGVGGWLVYRHSSPAPGGAAPAEPIANPLELGAAFLFGAVFIAILVLTHLAREYLGRAGLFSLAAVMGVTDVDPFIMGLTQTTSSAVPVATAASAIVIAAASNNIVKAVYAYAFGERATGTLSLKLLLAFGAIGMIPLIWMV